MDNLRIPKNFDPADLLDPDFKDHVAQQEAWERQATAERTLSTQELNREAA